MAKSTLDAVVAGHLCLDISPDLKTLTEPVHLERIFAPSRLTDIGPAALSTGGVVSNTGLALRRLGLRVGLMGKCGADTFGQTVLELLNKEAPGSAAATTLVKNEPTSYTIVLSPPGIDRFFLHCRGANDTFGFADLDMEVIRQARLFHFGYPTLLKRTLANKGRESIKIFKEIHQLGVTTSLDLSMPDPNSAEGQLNWRELLPKLLPHVDVFLPSVEELMFLLAPASFKSMTRRSKGRDLLANLDMKQVMRLADQCLAMGVKIMVIKCGRLGIYAQTTTAEQLSKMGKARPQKNVKDWAGREIFEPSFRVKKVVSALGAGDCAVAGFLGGLLRSVSLADALRYSTAVGAQNVQVTDAVSGTKSWRQTTAQIRKRPPKVTLPIDMGGWQRVAAERHYRGPHDHVG
ncbi:MAG: carbohydrate kinase family protein [Actinobacteria bacterium]|nr:carbohydrate kinase family protein [Actinomycetota bacterium]